MTSRRRLTLPLLVVTLHGALGTGAAMAHGVAPGAGAALEQAPIWLTRAIFTFAWLSYTLGAVRHRPQFGPRLAFHAAMLAAGVALFGPLDDWAERSTAWHMVQHMLLIVVVAPLAVLARPLPQWRAAIGPLADSLWRGLHRLSRRPMACAMLHAAAIWIWHAPGPYVAAIEHPAWHVTEHACFLLTGWLFWWSVLRPGRTAALPAALALLFTVMHTGLLGALLTFSSTPLYRPESRALWDQQLAGLVMWVPGGLVYLGAAVWAAWPWLQAMESRPGITGSTHLSAGARPTP